MILVSTKNCFGFFKARLRTVEKKHRRLIGDFVLGHKLTTTGRLLFVGVKFEYVDPTAFSTTPHCFGINLSPLKFWCMVLLRRIFVIYNNWVSPNLFYSTVLFFVRCFCIV